VRVKCRGVIRVSPALISLVADESWAFLNDLLDVVLNSASAASPKARAFGSDDMHQRDHPECRGDGRVTFGQASRLFRIMPPRGRRRVWGVLWVCGHNVAGGGARGVSPAANPDGKMRHVYVAVGNRPYRADFAHAV